MTDRYPKHWSKALIYALEFDYEMGNIDLDRYKKLYCNLCKDSCESRLIDSALEAIQYIESKFVVEGREVAFTV